MAISDDERTAQGQRRDTLLCHGTTQGPGWLVSSTTKTRRRGTSSRKLWLAAVAHTNNAGKSPNWPFQTAEHVPALAPAGTWLVWITFLLFLDRHLLIRSSRIDPAPRQLQEVGRFRGRRDASENGAPAGPCEELFPLYYEGARSRSRSRDASLKRLVWFGELAPGAPVKGVVPSLQSRGVQKSRGRPLSGLIFQPAGRMKCLGASQRACPL